MMELFRAQGEATVAFWSALISGKSFPDAVQAQTAAIKQAYDASTAHWGSVAAASGRVMGQFGWPTRWTWPGERR